MKPDHQHYRRARGGILASVAGILVSLVHGCPTTCVAQGRPDTIWMQGGHSDSVSDLALSPDGQLMASAGRDETVKLWRVSDGRLLRTLNYFRPVSVAFSPDNTLVAAGGAANDVRVWRIADGAVVQSFRDHSNDVHSVQFSADGSLIVSAGKDLAARIWRVTDGQVLHTLRGHTGIIVQATFSPNGALAASWGLSEVYLWRVSDGSLVQAFTNMSGALHVAFSPDSTQMAWVDTQRSTLVLRRVSDGTVTGRIGQTQTNSIYEAEYLADGLRIATLHADSTVRVWRLTDGALLQEIRSPYLASYSMAISPDSTQAVLSGSPQGVITIGQQISLWNLNNGALVRVFSAYDISVSDIAVSPGSAEVAAANSDAIRIWRTLDGALLLTITNQPNRRVNALAFSPDGIRLAAATRDFSRLSTNHTVEFWNPSNGQQLGTIRGHTNEINSVAYSLNGQYLATGSADRSVKLWRTSDGAELRTLTGHTNSVRRVTFSPDGTALASASVDFSVRMWRVQDGGPIWTTNLVRSGAFDIAFSPDGQTVALGNPGNAIHLLRASDGFSLGSLAGHTGAVFAVVYSPDGKYLVSGGDDALRVWDAATRALITAYDQEVVTRIRSIAFSPDGRYLVYGRSDATLVVATAPGSTPRLELRVLGYSGTAGFRFKLRGLTNQAFRVETSTNLQSWMTFTNLFNLSGEIDVLDSTLGVLPRRFYRAVME